jgi:hypothetical protein
MGWYFLVLFIGFACGALVAGRSITGKWFVFKSKPEIK